MNAGTFSRHIQAGRLHAEEQLDHLENGYRVALQTAGTHASKAFAQLAVHHLTADASNPGWTPPEDSQLIDAEALQADAKKRTRTARHAALKAVASPALADIGIAYDLTNPLAAQLIDTLGVRARDLTDAVRDQIAQAVLNGYQQGLSVVDTAKAIKAAAWDIAPSRAAMLARTDLNSIANGASVMAARIVNGAADPGEPQVGFKRWIATEDERTRETHAQADGQVVPLDQPFIVGGEEADYPCDPDLSDEESCNCRCAVGYADGADVAVTASSAPTDGVASGGLMETSPASDLHDEAVTADVTVIVGDDSTAAPEPLTPTRWRAILCTEGQDTQDSAALIRVLAEGETTWRDLPLPLGVMYETPHSDEFNAELCGQIDTIYRDAGDFRVIWGEGSFNLDDQGARAAARVADLSLRGISIDPYVPRVEVFDQDATEENAVPQTRVVMHDAVICAATICPVQALDGAQIAVIASVDQEDDHLPYGVETCFVLAAAASEPRELSALEVLAASTETERLATLERSIGALSELTASVVSLHASVESLEHRTTQREAKDAAVVTAIQDLAGRDDKFAGLPAALAASASQVDIVAAIAENQQRQAALLEGLASQLLSVVGSVDSLPELLQAEREARDATNAAFIERLEGLARVSDALVATVKAGSPRRALNVVRDDSGRPIRYESEDTE